MKLTVSEEIGQVPLVIVHAKVFNPIFNPVTPGLVDVVEVNVPLPEIIVHTPVPIAGRFPSNEDEVEQIVESIPAFAVVGNGSILIITVSVEFGQMPFEIVQTKVFIPTLNPVAFEEGEVGVVTIPVPLITVHTAVPTKGVFPSSSAVDEQRVWSAPA